MQPYEVLGGEVLPAFQTSVDVCLCIMDFIFFIRAEGDWVPVRR